MLEKLNIQMQYNKIAPLFYTTYTQKSTQNRLKTKNKTWNCKTPGGEIIGEELNDIGLDTSVKIWHQNHNKKKQKYTNRTTSK